MIIQIVDKIFLVYMLMLFVRIFSSWFPDFQNTRFVQFVAFYTDPYLNIFRSIIPPLGPLDISPIVAFFALSVIEYSTKFFIVSLLR